MAIFPGTNQRFCDYHGNSTWGECNTESYVLVHIVTMAGLESSKAASLHIHF